MILIKKLFPVTIILFLIANFNCALAKNNNPWSELFIKDINFIKTTLIKNHPGTIDTANPDFNKWLEQGYKKALIHSKKIQDYDGLFFAELEYINGFQDGHLNLQFHIKRDTYFYPGIILKKIDNNFIVSDSEIKEVPLYSELLTCNNKSAKQLLEEYVSPYFGIKNLVASDMLITPYILTERFNPLVEKLNNCRFKLPNGQVFEHQLTYSPISKSLFEMMASKAAFGNSPEHFSLRQFDDAYWLTLPNFWPEGKEFELAKKVIAEFSKKIADIKKSKALVIDVRGNSGGSSHWGHEIAEILWGSEQLKKIESEMSKNEKVEWRISKDNLEHIKSMATDISSRFGKDAPISKYFEQTKLGIEKAAKEKKSFFTQSDEVEVKTLPVQEIKKLDTKIYFLTDGHCMSACLDFADYLLARPEVIHIGLPTWADTNYMEVRSVELPSKLAQLNFAIKVYRGRKRKTNQPYIPQIKWRDSMANDGELEKWILEQK